MVLTFCFCPWCKCPSEKGKIAHGVGRTPRDFFEGDKEAEQQ